MMKKKKMKMKKKKSFPDVSGDGKITKKDILMARGVIPKNKNGMKKKKKMTKGQKKVKKVMKEFKKGTLKIGGSDKKVKNRKQAIAIALNRAGISKNRRKNGKRG